MSNDPDPFVQITSANGTSIQVKKSTIKGVEKASPQAEQPKAETPSILSPKA